MPQSFLAAVVHMLALAAPAPAHPASTPARDPAALEDAELQSGSYRYAGSAAERAERDAAIDRVVSQMNWLIRSIARARLRGATPISRNVTVERDGDWLAVTFDGRRYASQLGGPAVEVRGLNGEPLQLTQRLRDGDIEQTFIGKDGGRRNLLHCDGDRVILSVSVFSAKLPRDVRYRLTYRRAE